MDQLNQIITQKLKLISHYRSLPNETLTANREVYADELLKEKRKQNSREVLESRLLQSLSSHKIQAPYRMEQFFRHSAHFLKIYDSDFAYQFREEDQVLNNIVKLYAEFFRKQECDRRAEELLHIFKKSLCQKGMLIPTILNWFIDWLRKTFKTFIKETLTKLKGNDNPKDKEKKKGLSKKVAEEIENHRESIKKIERKLEENKNQSLADLKKSKLLEPEEQQTQVKTHRKENFALRGKKSVLLINNQKNLKAIENVSCEKIQSIPRSPSIAENKAKQFALIQIKQNSYSPIFNKQMFFSAYYEEMGEYYKFYSFLPDLDLSYPRSFRKVDRRDEMKTKYMQIAKSFARAQPLIKKSQEEYIEVYQKYKKKRDMIILLKKEKKKSEQLVNKQRKLNEGQKWGKKENLKKRESLQRSSDKSLSKIKRNISLSPNTRIKTKIHSKTMEIQLPEIPKNIDPKAVDKSSMIHLKKERYQQETRHVNKRSRASADLYKDIHEINSLFQQNSSNKRLQFSARRIKEKHSSISRYIEMDLCNEEMGDDGIFRLPKIGK